MIARPARRGPVVGLLLTALLLFGCSDSPDAPLSVDVQPLVDACIASAGARAASCTAQCERLGDETAMAECNTVCEADQDTEASQCAAVNLDALTQFCASGDCSQQVGQCLAESATVYDGCAAGCAPDNAFCGNRCLDARAIAETACAYRPAVVLAGSPTLPALPQGEPAVLEGVLDADELAVVMAADEAAGSHRQRDVILVVDDPGADVVITQVAHHFRFGVPLDSREFDEGDGRLSFYGDIARPQANLLVAETSLKWRNTERERDNLTFDLADFEIDWAESLGFDVKAHVLLWGNPQPLASGSGTPDWLLEAFPGRELDASERAALNALIEQRIRAVVGRYRGRIDVWEVTNEMLNPITSWFVDRLGPTVVNDAFAWARVADPGAELVYNEWIADIFTGLGGPDAVAVRDRVLALLAEGVQVDALGQQGHFAPGLVNVGIDEGLDERTRIDDYAAALATLAETGLPIHITEVTFAAPQDPGQRAAQAEAVMRLWWGHPQVEEIIFWNFWNPLGPRSRLDLGLYDDAGNLSRHGEAIFSLLNDRWRTRLTAASNATGAVEFRGTLGDYVAQWDTPEGPVFARFEVPPGEGPYRVVLAR